MGFACGANIADSSPRATGYVNRILMGGQTRRYAGRKIPDVVYWALLGPCAMSASVPLFGDKWTLRIYEYMPWDIFAAPSVVRARS